MTGSARPKIAVLGSGVGAMTAAYELAVQDNYDITVYQIGWRLGGQGASGRNLDDGARIEEHGLHVWFGFYHNAFSLMRRCYADLNRPPDAPLATPQKAWIGQDSFMFRETYDGQTHPWRINFPSDPLSFPGSDDAPDLPTMDKVVTNLLENASAYFVTQLSGYIPLVSLAHPFLRGFANLFSGFEEGGKAVTAEIGRSVFQHVMERFAARDDHAVIVAILKDLRRWAGDLSRPFLDHDDPRRAWSLVDLLLTIVIGVLEDGILENGFDVISDKDFREWLNDKGADPLVSNGPLIQSLYDIFFAYEGGDVSRPSVEAGPALRGSLRTMLTYQGHVLYKMNAGMGDTVFAPLYLALKQRGVTFKFFHRVEKLVYDAAANSISAIRIARQVDLSVPEYAPLVDVKGLPCWPSKPLTDQIVNGQALKGVDLESMWSGWTDAGQTTLQLGQDFDQVILGITVAGLPFICDEKLLALEPWKKMLANVQTVRTQAVQLWFNRPSGDLGFPVTGGIIADCDEPDACWADFMQVLPREDDPPETTGLFYGCGVLSDDGPLFPPPTDVQFPGQQLDRVRDTTLQFLQNAGVEIWPLAAVGRALDWTVLAAPPHVLGAQRLNSQYLRANIDPSERYVLTVVGSSQYRLQPGGSGVSNLFLVGSWVDNGFNLSCVEAAAMSGMQASRAIPGTPATVYGEHGFVTTTI